MIGRMLAVRINGYDMRKPVRVGLSYPMQDRCSFALITRQYQDPQVRVVHGHAGKLLACPIGTTIDDNPDRPLLAADRCYSRKQPRAGVVARDEHEMGSCDRRVWLIRWK